MTPGLLQAANAGSNNKNKTLRIAEEYPIDANLA
jgi:hypothetical protein